jgi:hypothetical protein
MGTWLFFFFLGKIPSILWLLIAGGGVVVYVLSGVLTRVPPLSIYAMPAKILSILAMVFGVYMYGGASINNHYAQKIKEMEAKIAVAEAQSQAVNTVIEERVQTRVQIIKDNQVVYRDKIIEIAPELDAVCPLPPSVSDIHNSAAKYPFADTVNKAAKGQKK